MHMVRMLEILIYTLYSNIYNGQNAGNTHQHVDFTGPTPILKAFTKLPLIIHFNLELPTMQVGTHHLYWVEELACRIETRNGIENRNQSNVIEDRKPKSYTNMNANAESTTQTRGGTTCIARISSTRGRISARGSFFPPLLLWPPPRARQADNKIDSLLVYSQSDKTKL